MAPLIRTVTQPPSCSGIAAEQSRRHTANGSRTFAILDTLHHRTVRQTRQPALSGRRSSPSAYHHRLNREAKCVSGSSFCPATCPNSTPQPRPIRLNREPSPPKSRLHADGQSCNICPQMALTGSAGRLEIGRLLKVDRQCFRCGRSSQSVPEVEPPRSMNAAYSQRELVDDARSKLNRSPGNEVSRGRLRACIPSCRLLARSPPQVIRPP